MDVYLVRHAPTRGNLEKRYIGATDEPLCEEGVALARAAAARGLLPPVGEVFCSPLLRARQTARILAPEASLVVAEGLSEMGFGAFEGRTYLEMADDARYRSWVDGGCTDPCPGGESQEGFRARVEKAFAGIVEGALEEGSRGPVAVVAHGGTLMAALSAFAEPRRDYWDWSAPHCGGFSAQVKGTQTCWYLANVRPL